MSHFYTGKPCINLGQVAYGVPNRIQPVTVSLLLENLDNMGKDYLAKGGIRGRKKPYRKVPKS